MDSRGLITEANRKWWTLGAMCLSMFMIMLDSTVVNVALPSIQKDLKTSVDKLEWVVNGYALSFAALLVTGGRLGDIFGRRLIFMIGVSVFAISSARAGLAPDPTTLVVSRIAEGVGGALMMPATLSIITDAFPAEERGKAIGTWAGISGLALSFGPLAGGFLTEDVTWRAIFYINLPIAVLALLASLFAVHLLPVAQLHRRQHRRDDHQLRDDGQLLLPRLLPSGPARLLAARDGCALPADDNRDRHRRPDRGSGGRPDRLEVADGPRAGDHGRRALPLFSRMTATTTYSDLLVAFILLGFGIGITMSQMSTAAMNAVAIDKAGVASGTLQMFRRMGGTIGVAATGAIFQGRLGEFNPALLAQGGVAEATKFTDALGAAMALGAAVTAVGAVIATVVIRGKPRHELSAHGGPSCRAWLWVNGSPPNALPSALRACGHPRIHV